LDQPLDSLNTVHAGASKRLEQFSGLLPWVHWTGPATRVSAAWRVVRARQSHGLPALGAMVACPPVSRHRFLAVVLLGHVLVMGMTHEPDLLWIVVSTKGKGMAVVELEPVTLGASPTLLVDIPAPASVALVHGAPDGSGNPT